MVISKLKNVGAAGPLGELGCEGLRGHVWRLHDFRVYRFAAKKLNMSKLNVYIYSNQVPFDARKKCYGFNNLVKLDG